jgi:flagellar protein FlbD
MIVVTRLDKQQMFLNPDHIICIEETPDTVITLFNGNRYIVVDKARTIISRVIVFRSNISRRAARRSPKKYLGRIRCDWVHRESNLPDDAFSDNQGKQNHIPFHSRDY